MPFRLAMNTEADEVIGNKRNSVENTVTFA
jgi:hypothetical protein